MDWRGAINNRQAGFAGKRAFGRQADFVRRRA